MDIIAIESKTFEQIKQRFEDFPSRLKTCVEIIRTKKNG